MRKFTIVTVMAGYFNAGVIGYLLTKHTPTTKLEMIWFAAASLSVVVECILNITLQLGDEGENDEKPN